MGHGVIRKQSPSIFRQRIPEMTFLELLEHQGCEA